MSNEFNLILHFLKPFSLIFDGIFLPKLFLATVF